MPSLRKKLIRKINFIDFLEKSIPSFGNLYLIHYWITDASYQTILQMLMLTDQLVYIWNYFFDEESNINYESLLISSTTRLYHGLKLSDEGKFHFNILFLMWSHSLSLGIADFFSKILFPEELDIILNRYNAARINFFNMKMYDIKDLNDLGIWFDKLSESTMIARDIEARTPNLLQTQISEKDLLNDLGNLFDKLSESSRDLEAKTRHLRKFPNDQG